MNDLSGLIVEVYRCSVSDCSKNGVTANNNSVLLILPQGGPFRAKDFVLKMPLVEIDKREDMSLRHGQDCSCARPYGIDGTNYSFGGNFIYSSDSRFPGNRPIPVHDRKDF
ncbi:MAG: hypothetical protein M0P12_03105 [Paludibacteraceae bacterium]|nr:hypothetical protein [Paludibacteraceae bacterium]MCK9615918.1 hypothetical protein [Candidatus Omnitrophota bacterium]